MKICVETRLQTALISLWPDNEAADHYWRENIVPMLKKEGFSPLLVSLLPSEGRRQSPTNALLSRLVASIDPAAAGEIKGASLYLAIEHLLDKKWSLGQNLVLAVTGFDRWAGSRWRNDVAAFRAIAQANQERLFVVYACSDADARRRIFSDRNEPLYREGMSVAVNADGTI